MEEASLTRSLVDGPGEFGPDDAGVGDFDEELAWLRGLRDGEGFEFELFGTAWGVEADGFHGLGRRHGWSDRGLKKVCLSKECSREKVGSILRFDELILGTLRFLYILFSGSLYT